MVSSSDKSDLIIKLELGPFFRDKCDAECYESSQVLLHPPIVYSHLDAGTLAWLRQREHGKSFPDISVVELLVTIPDGFPFVYATRLVQKYVILIS